MRKADDVTRKEEREADDAARKEEAPLDWKHEGHDAGIYDEDVACVACASMVGKTLGMDRWPLPLMKNVPRHQEK